MCPSSSQHDMDARSEKIVKLLVQDYLRTGEPVGSRTLAKKSSVHLSPATVRNIMSDLEDLGIIKSVHASSGRIPTAKGLSVYVRRLATLRQPDDAVLQRLTAALSVASAGDAAAGAAHIVAQITRGVVIVTMPSAQSTPMQQLRLVRLSSSRALAVMVTESGEVRNHLIEFPKGMSEGDLELAAQYFNEHFSGMTLKMAEQNMQKHVSSMRRSIASLLRNMLSTVSNSTTSPEMITAGEDKLFTHPNLAHNADKLRRLVALLNQKEKILKLLEHGKHAEEVKVFIGSEGGVKELGDCALVTTSYELGSGEVIGALGLIGPLCMRYSTVVPLIDTAGKMMSDAMSRIRHSLN